MSIRKTKGIVDLNKVFLYAFFCKCFLRDDLSRQLNSEGHAKKSFSMHFELRGTSIHLLTQVVSGTSKKEKAADKLNEALFHSNFESKLTMSAKEIVESFQPEHKEGIVIGISSKDPSSFFRRICQARF